MKPFMCIDKTLDKKNEAYNGEEFVVETASAAQSEALEKASDGMLDLVFKKARLPWYLRIFRMICAIGGTAIVMGILRFLADSEESLTFADLYDKASWLFWLGGLLLVGWGILEVLHHRKEKEVMEGEESQNLSNDLDTIVQTISAEFGIPADAADLEILSFDYKEKKGEPVPQNVELGYVNCEMWAYRKDDQLILANADKKYALPLSAMRRIQTVQKSICLFSWDKEISYKEEPYKAYKITENDDGCIRIKSYHILELEHEGTLWGIYFPNYELPTVEKLTGLKAE